MAILDSIGTSLIVGGQKVVLGATIGFTSYIVVDEDENDVDMDSEDINNEDGARASRLIFIRDNKPKFTLVCKTGAVPLTDFPAKDMCTVAGLTQYFVDSATITKSKSAQRVTVQLINLGIT